MYAWNIPTKVLFGAGKLKALHGETMPGKKALIVISNGKSVRTNGSLGKLENELNNQSLPYIAITTSEGYIFKF